MKSYIKGHFNKTTARQVESFFNNLGLPLPQETWQGKEYTKATEGGLITFLNDAACVIRLTPHFAGQAKTHPHILKPLFQRDCGLMRAEIFPGLASPISYDDLMRLRSLLNRDDISFWDDSKANGGYLPYFSLPQFPKGVPVVIDVAACNDLLAGVRWARAALRKLTGQKRTELETEALQDELYGELREAFATAWPAGKNHSDPTALARAWNMCADMKQQGLLITNWQTERIRRNYKNSKIGGMLYAKSCQAYRENKAAVAPSAQP